jgi:hypothetical protein
MFLELNPLFAGAKTRRFHSKEGPVIQRLAKIRFPSVIENQSEKKFAEKTNCKALARFFAG